MDILKMKGIKVLSEAALYESEILLWISGTMFVITCICMAIILFVIDEKKDPGRFAILAITMILSFLTFIATGTLSSVLPIDKNIVGYEYKISVSEEANFSEIIEQYEIIDQEGKILTIKTKE